MRFSIAALAASVMVAAAFIGGAAPARASFIGAEMTASYQYPTLGSIYGQASWTPPTFTVGGGVETVGNVENVTSIAVNFASSSLSMLLTTVLGNPTWGGADFNGPVITATSTSKSRARSASGTRMVPVGARKESEPP